MTPQQELGSFHARVSGFSVRPSATTPADIRRSHAAVLKSVNHRAVDDLDYDRAVTEDDYRVMMQEHLIRKGTNPAKVGD